LGGSGPPEEKKGRKPLDKPVPREKKKKKKGFNEGNGSTYEGTTVGKGAGSRPWRKKEVTEKKKGKRRGKLVREDSKRGGECGSPDRNEAMLKSIVETYWNGERSPYRKSRGKVLGGVKKRIRG